MKNRNRGFTLIECIVIIAIMGILASIVGIGLPGYQKFIDKSRLNSETKLVLQSILKARADTIMDGKDRRIYIFTDTNRIIIKKISETLLPAEKVIYISGGTRIANSTYLGGLHLDLKPIGTVNRGGHITLKSSRGKYMTIVIQIGSGRIYMKEGMIDD